MFDHGSRRCLAFTSSSLSAALLLFAVGVSGATSVASANGSRPNIILVFIDDLGWGDFSCFGNKDAKTTNIDRLAAEGIRFEQFYVNSPICSPSRVAVTTGDYPQRWRITSYLAHRRMNEERGMAQWLDPEATTLARKLNRAGYATGHFGKWHMGGQRDVAEAPPILDYGFDDSLTNFEGMGAKLLPLTLKPGQVEPGRIWADAERLGEPATWMLRSKITGGFIDAAIAFIEKAGRDGKPFYLNLWPDDVHSPFWPPVERWGDGSKRERYLAVLEEMDRQLGELFDYVRNNERLHRNTLVLVCSDNGPEPGAGEAGPFRGVKTQLYEGGIRSPLVVWGPGLIARVKGGVVNKQSFFAAIDLVPSLLAITGASPPESQFDGVPIPGVLLGKSTKSRGKPLFFRRPPDRDSFYGVDDLPDLAVRDGRWKLLCEYDGSQPELYDLAVDRAEDDNVAAEQPAVVRRLTAELLAWHRSMPPDKGATYKTAAQLKVKPSRSAPR
jgi:uncharacterized sulfatase